MKKKTVNYILEGTRFAMGIGAAKFIRGIYKVVTASSSKPAKVCYFLSSLATWWAIAHSIDNYIDDRAKVIFGIRNSDGALTDEFVSEFMNE